MWYMTQHAYQFSAVSQHMRLARLPFERWLRVTTERSLRVTRKKNEQKKPADRYKTSPAAAVKTSFFSCLARVVSIQSVGIKTCVLENKINFTCNSIPNHNIDMFSTINVL